MFALLMTLVAPNALADDVMTGEFQAGYVGGRTNGMPDLADRFSFSGMLLGGSMGARSVPDDRPPITEVSLGFRSALLNGGRAGGSKLELAPAIIGEQDPVTGFQSMDLHITLAPAPIRIGELTLAPQLGVAMTLTAYNWDFALAPLSNEYDETSSYFAQNYGDFYGLSAGTWASLPNVLTEARFTWLPAGPLLASGVEPRYVSSINGSVSDGGRLQAGTIMNLTLGAEWTGAKAFAPGVRYEGQTWKVVTDGQGDAFGGTSRSGHSTLYATAGFRLGL